MIDREYYESLVNRPGKFEGEAPYVPYYWEKGLEGGADEDAGNIQGFGLTMDDARDWPELEGRHWLWLRESDDGFVSELDSDFPATFDALLDEVMDSLF